MFGNKLINTNAGGGCTDTVDLYNPFPDGGGVALYQLNGNATDVSGNYDGTATNVTYGAGEFGQAGLFSTSTSKVLLPQTYGAEGETFSYSFWFNTTTNGTNVYDSEFIINKRNGANTFQINITNGGKLLVSDWRGTPLNAQSTTTVTDGTWRNVVFTYDNSIGKVYINGAQETSMNFTNDLATQSITNGNCLGNFDQNSRVFSGSLDQVRVFNRVLRPYEVEALYTEEYCTPTIVPSEHFNTVLYTGTGATNPVTGVGFQPNLVWVKTRDRGYPFTHRLTDSVRGATKQLNSDTTDSEAIENGVLSFNSDGFTLGNAAGFNISGDAFVSWNFKAGGAAVTNTDGTITSQVSANTEAGFSIVSWTGNASAATVGHGLQTTPSMIIVKSRDVTGDWFVYNKNLNGGVNTGQYFMFLNTTDSELFNISSVWNGLAPTSSIFNLGISANKSGGNVAYCFAEVEGFSNFGSYVGTGASGNTVVTGFEPAFVMIKCTSGIMNWAIFDNKRDTTNPNEAILYPNLSLAETNSAGSGINFLSNGFELDTTSGGWINNSGATYIYMAFAADPTTIEPSLEDSFNTVTWTGNGSSSNAITGVGFQPDLTWIKSRSINYNHQLHDSVRGAGNALYSDLTGADGQINTMNSFDADGFTVNASSFIGTNANGQTFVAWNWKGAEIPAINSNGSIPSVVSANPAAGFSIVSWTTTSAAAWNVGHGLDTAPNVIISKMRTTAGTWWEVYHSSLGTGKYLALQTTGATYIDAGAFSSVTDATWTSYTTNTLGSYIAYCFAEVAGFSKFGSYTGTSAAGNKQTIGFEPAFVMVKPSNITDPGWYILDNKRSTTEYKTAYLQANASNAEADATPKGIKFEIDGFSFNSDAFNNTGWNFIYMAFANQF